MPSWDNYLGKVINQNGVQWCSLVGGRWWPRNDERGAGAGAKNTCVRNLNLADQTPPIVSDLRDWSQSELDKMKGDVVPAINQKRTNGNSPTYNKYR